jgi:hypothetical protein
MDKEISEKKQFERDCPGYNYLPSILPAVPRILAIGDLHGDVKLTINMFRSLKLIDCSGTWIATPKNTVVVQVGDQLDSCRPGIKPCSDPTTTTNDVDDIILLHFFTDLHRQAIRYGGGVYSLFGNHEVLNARGIMDYVSLKSLTHFFDSDPFKLGINPSVARTIAFKPTGLYARFLACTRLSALVIGSNIFVHAGISPEFAKAHSIKDLNKDFRDWLLGRITKDYIKEIITGTDESVFWTRVLGQIPPGEDISPACSEYLAPALKILKLNHIIIGHTPQSFVHEKGINSSCDGKVWRTDIGVSKSFDMFDQIEGRLNTVRVPQVLEIIDDSIFSVIKT